MRTHYFSAVALMLLFPVLLSAQNLLAEWTFENVSGIPATPIDPTDLGSGVDYAYADIAGGHNNGSPDVCGGAETWSTNFWPTGGYNLSEYIAFTLQVGAAEKLYLQHIELTTSVSSAKSVTHFRIAVEVNGEMTFIANQLTSTSCLSMSTGIDKTADAGSIVNVYIFPYGQNVTGLAASFRVDDVALYGETVLPVELLSFTGKTSPNGVQLDWTTASELNNDYIELQRSPDGQSFVPLVQLPGHGTTQQAQHYRYTDPTPLAGTNYYRLLQVDFDGSSTAHPVIAVNHQARQLAALPLTPNPARNRLYLPTLPVIQNDIIFTIHDTYGQQRLNGVVHQQEINISDLPPGQYWLRLLAENVLYQELFVKM